MLFFSSSLPAPAVPRPTPTRPSYLSLITRSPHLLHGHLVHSAHFTSHDHGPTTLDITQSYRSTALAESFGLV